jgi:hypothetical protein
MEIDIERGRETKKVGDIERERKREGIQKVGERQTKREKKQSEREKNGREREG